MDAADAVEVEVDSADVDVENQEPEMVANIVVHLTMDVPQNFTTTNACATPTDGISQMVTTCRFPDKNHEFDAPADDPKGACGLYKRLSHKA